MNLDKFFVQLSLDFSNLAEEIEELTLSHGYRDPGIGWEHADFDFYNINPNLRQKIKESLPDELRSVVRNVRVAIIKGQIVYPHIDHKGLVSVNYHILTGNAKTKFWSAKPDAIRYQVPGEETSNVFRYEDLVEECGYVAAEKSCYLLNTALIHDVTLESKDSVRKLLQLTFEPTVDYDTVLNIMLKLNLVKEQS